MRRIIGNPSPLVKDIFQSLVCSLAVIPAARSPLSDKAVGQIAFSALVEGNWDLWIMKADGTGLRRLTQTPVDERTPCLSADGRKVIYATSEGKLMIMDLSDASPEQIPLSGGRHGNPVWLNASKIAFVSFTFNVEKDKVNDDSSVFVYDLSRNPGQDNPRLLIDQTGLQNWPSAFGGRYLLYSSSVQGPNQEITQDVWIYDLMTQNGDQVTMLNASANQAKWSPDGKEIVFSSNKTGNYEIWKCVMKTGALTRLTTTRFTNTEPCWSPDGRRIVFVSDWAGRRNLWAMSRDGNGPREWSPLGDKVECISPFWGN